MVVVVFLFFLIAATKCKMIKPEFSGKTGREVCVCVCVCVGGGGGGLGFRAPTSTVYVLSPVQKENVWLPNMLILNRVAKQCQTCLKQTVIKS